MMKLKKNSAGYLKNSSIFFFIIAPAIPARLEKGRSRIFVIAVSPNNLPRVRGAGHFY
jgi:hypothetical protein